MVKCNIGWYAGSKIPQILNEAIKEAVNTGNYLNSSDFIRDAIKEKLQREGYLMTIGIPVGDKKLD